MKKIVILFLLLLFSVPCFASGRYEALLKTAESSFAEGNYQKSIEIYETLVQTEKVNDPDIYYNLSNAYYRNGELGRAVLNIEKAYMLNPGDKDIRYNRLFLEMKAGTPEKESFAGFTERIVDICSLNGMTIIVAFLFVLGLTAASAYLFKRKKTFKRISLTALAFFLLFGMLFAVKIKRNVFDTEAVMLESFIVRSGPGINNPEVFEVSEGRKVYVSGKNNDWTYINVEPESFSGWVENRSVEKING